MSLQRELAERTQAEATLRLVAEHIDAVFWVASPDSRTLHYISPGYTHLSGQPLASLHADAHAFLAVVHPDDRPLVHDTITRERSQGSDLIYRILRPDGSTIWVRDRAFPVADAAGAL